MRSVLADLKDRVFAGVALSKGFVNEEGLLCALTELHDNADGELTKACVRLGFITQEELDNYESLLRAAIAQSGQTEEAFLQGRATELAASSAIRKASPRLLDFLIGAVTKISPPSHTRVQTSVSYELKSLKGRGGLGEVWVGRDAAMDRDVAVKRMLPHVKGENFRRRFLQEARITGQLQHPNIVPVYELGTNDNELFYSMRLVDGRTLHQEIEDYHRIQKNDEIDRVGLTRLLESFLKAAQAIAYAHDNGVLHRDLKPENIMVGRFGEVVVLDWGLAKVKKPQNPNVDLTAMNEPATESSLDDPMTRAGSVLGSPLYMAPEQAAGASDCVDVRTDVYGLGGILYESLTGRPPHPPVYNQPVREFLAAIQTREVDPVRKHRPQMPRSLSAIVAKALARRPDDRYQSASALIDDIQCFLAGEPVSALPDSLLARLTRWSGRHRGVVMALCAVLLALVVFVTILMTLDAQSRHTEEEKQIATLRQRLKNAAHQTTASMRWIPDSMRFLREVLPATIGAARFRTRSDLPQKTIDDISQMLLAFVRSDPEFLEFAVVPPANLDEASIRVSEDPFSKIVSKADGISEPICSRQLLEAVLRKPNETHFGSIKGIEYSGRRLIVLNLATGITHERETAAIVVARIWLSDYFFSNVVALAQSDDSFAYMFDDERRCLLYVSANHEIQFASGVKMFDLFPALSQAIDDRPAGDNDEAFGGLYDEGILLGEDVYFDPARPERRLTVVFGKTTGDLYAPLLRVYNHVGATAAAAMFASLAALFALSWLLLRNTNRWN